MPVTRQISCKYRDFHSSFYDPKKIILFRFISCTLFSISIYYANVSRFSICPYSDIYDELSEFSQTLYQFPRVLTGSSYSLKLRNCTLITCTLYLVSFPGCCAKKPRRCPQRLRFFLHSKNILRKLHKLFSDGS